LGIAKSLKTATREFRRRIFPSTGTRVRSRPKLSGPPSYDYWSLYRRGGLRLALAFFRECHAFDLLRGTDTHAELPNTKYAYAPQNFERGSWYLSSWTRELLNSFAVVKNYLGDDFHNYAFVDVGCGKGKALLLWQEQLDKLKLRSPVIGIEYYEPLAAIARRNYAKLFKKPGNIIASDATQFDHRQFGDKLIIYMFHPFDDVIMRKLLGNLSGLKTVVIYNNPVHKDVLLDFRYSVIYRKTGWNLMQSTTIFASESLAKGQ
jgi:SAM-dependent methyltransferase